MYEQTLSSRKLNLSDYRNISEFSIFRTLCRYRRVFGDKRVHFLKKQAFFIWFSPVMIIIRIIVLVKNGLWRTEKHTSIVARLSDNQRHSIVKKHSCATKFLKLRILKIPTNAINAFSSHWTSSLCTLSIYMFRQTINFSCKLIGNILYIYCSKHNKNL